MAKISEILAPPLWEQDALWLEENAPEYYTAVQTAVSQGVTPQAIYTYYMQQSPGRQALWTRCKHTAAWLTSNE